MSKDYQFPFPFTTNYTINGSEPHDGTISFGDWQLGGKVIPPTPPSQGPLSVVALTDTSGQYAALLQEVASGSFTSDAAFDVNLYPEPANPSVLLNIKNFSWGDFDITYPRIDSAITHSSQQILHIADEGYFPEFSFKSVAYDAAQKTIIQMDKGHYTGSGYSAQRVTDAASTYIMEADGTVASPTELPTASFPGGFPEYLSTTNRTVVLRYSDELSRLQVMNDDLTQHCFSNNQMSSGSTGFNAGFRVSSHPKGLWAIQSQNWYSQDSIKIFDSNCQVLNTHPLPGAQSYRMSNIEDYTLADGNTFLIDRNSITIFSPELSIERTIFLPSNPIVQSLPVQPSPQPQLAALLGNCNSKADCTVKIYDLNGGLLHSGSPFPTSGATPVFYDSVSNQINWLLTSYSQGMSLSMSQVDLSGNIITSTEFAHCAEMCKTHDIRVLDGDVRIIWSDLKSTGTCVYQGSCPATNTMYSTTVKYSLQDQIRTLLLGNVDAASILNCAIDTNPQGCVAIARHAGDILIGAANAPYPIFLHGAKNWSNQFVLKWLNDAGRKLAETSSNPGVKVNNFKPDDTLDISELLTDTDTDTTLEATNFGTSSVLNGVIKGITIEQIRVFFTNTAGAMILKLTGNTLSAIAAGDATLGQPVGLITDGSGSMSGSGSASGANLDSLSGSNDGSDGTAITGSGSGAANLPSTGSGSGSFTGAPIPDNPGSSVGMIIGIISTLLVLCAAGVAFIYCRSHSASTDHKADAHDTKNPLNDLTAPDGAHSTTVELAVVGAEAKGDDTE